MDSDARKSDSKRAPKDRGLAVIKRHVKQKLVKPQGHAARTPVGGPATGASHSGITTRKCKDRSAKNLINRYHSDSDLNFQNPLRRPSNSPASSSAPQLLLAHAAEGFSRGDGEGRDNATDFKEDGPPETSNVAADILSDAFAEEDEIEGWEDATGAVENTVHAPLEFELQRRGTAHTQEEIATKAAEKELRQQRLDACRAARETAQLLHRTELLFMIARGLLFDSAADDTLVQASLLSVREESSCTKDDSGLQVGNVARIADWFRSTFAVVDDPTPQELPDTLEAALQRDASVGRAGCGRDAVVAALHKAIAARSGGREEVAILFVALLRATGLSSRSVRSLLPVPLDASKAPDVALGKRKGHTYCDAATATHHPPPKAKQLPKKAIKRSDPSGPNPKTKVKKKNKNVVLESRDDNGGADGAKKRRKGDEELEQQLEMAMMATASSASAAEAAAASAATRESNEVPHSSFKRLGRTNPRSGGNGGARMLKEGDPSCWGGGGAIWAEVYCGNAATGRWLSLDCLAAWVDQPDQVSLSARAPIPYVVAFANGGAKDVTQRYVPSFLAAEKLRAGTWWDETMRPLRKLEASARLPAATCRAADGGAPQSCSEAAALPPQLGNRAHQGGAMSSQELQARREDAELMEKAIVERSALPTTIEGFKKHPDYVLQRHIGRYEALRPASKAVGMHKGESYFRRSDIGELHTAEGWRNRESREVMPDEMEHPYKAPLKRGRAQPAKGQDYSALGELPDDQFAMPKSKAVSVNEEEEALNLNVTKLYGDWQTRQWTMPAAQNGCVPKTERGNVNVPPYATHLPEGTVHLPHQRLAAVCRNLGIDFAHAMAGFDMRGGRSTPIISGVVVCIEFEDCVMTAWHIAEREREEQANRKVKAAADGDWRALLRAALMRVRLLAADPIQQQPWQSRGQEKAGGGSEALAAIKAARNKHAAASGKAAAAAIPRWGIHDTPTGGLGTSLEVTSPARLGRQLAAPKGKFAARPSRLEASGRLQNLSDHSEVEEI